MDFLARKISFQSIMDAMVCFLPYGGLESNLPLFAHTDSPHMRYMGRYKTADP